MADFKIAYKKTCSNEGLYSNDPDDTGGPTWKGIAYNKNPKWAGWNYFLLRFGGKFPNVISKEKLNILLLDSALEREVMSFYKSNYWDKVWGDKINIQPIADDMYDTAVNMGPATSVKLSQRQFKLKETGIMNDVLLRELNSIQL